MKTDKERRKAKLAKMVPSVKRRLAAKKSVPERSKRTLVLHTERYEKFNDLCRSEGLWPSDVIDEFIETFLNAGSEKK